MDDRIENQIVALCEAYGISHAGNYLLRMDWGKLDFTPVPAANLELLITWIYHNK